MKFAKPPFQRLLDSYQTSPLTAHDCPRVYAKDTEAAAASLNTCAIRMSEALVIANGLARDRMEIAGLDSGGKRHFSHLFANYSYKNNLCPHGLARGARDLAYFLQEQWGRPTKVWEKPVEQPKDLAELTGVIAFVKLRDDPSVQGHVDLWNKSAAVGQAFFNAETVLLWKLE